MQRLRKTVKKSEKGIYRRQGGNDGASDIRKARTERRHRTADACRGRQEKCGKAQSGVKRCGHCFFVSARRCGDRSGENDRKSEHRGY